MSDVTKQHIANDWEQFEKFRLKRYRGLTTGFSEVDKAIIGMPGLVTIQGDTGCGKSTWILNILANNAKKGIPVILVDKENGLQRTRLRLACLLGGLMPEAIESGNWKNDEEERYKRACAKLQKLPIYYLDNVAFERLELTITELGKKYKKHVLVVVDSLNRIARGGDDKKNDIDSWMTLFNDLKIKYENYVTFLIICEKSKSQYGAASTRGAKDSGEIDYIGELILDLYPTRDKSATTVECLKNRDGPKGVITVLRPSEPFTYEVNDVEYLPE